jgi:hypothetical protein
MSVNRVSKNTDSGTKKTVTVTMGSNTAGWEKEKRIVTRSRNGKLLTQRTVNTGIGSDTGKKYRTVTGSNVNGILSKKSGVAGPKNVQSTPAYSKYMEKVRYPKTAKGQTRGR